MHASSAPEPGDAGALPGLFAGLFGPDRSAAAPLCLDGATEISRAAVRADVLALAGTLEAPRVALHCTSARLFLIALAAAWSRGARVILPASDRSGHLEEIGTAFDLFLDDAAIDRMLAAAPRPPEPLPLPDPAALPDPRSLVAVLFTSGSTGAPKEILKTLHQLETEMRMQEPLWGPAVAAHARVLGLVSHQHIYGLLFRVIWPVMRGQAFQARQAPLWDDVMAEARPGDVLITSPAHLGRLHPDLADPGRMARPALVFCSGGPLDRAGSDATAQSLGIRPTEIYGSTETGGIAWRRQDGADTPWAPLPGVEVAAGDSGCLTVRAPHIAERAWHPTEDRCTIDPDSRTFRLGGRADRVMKVEGKRISLTAVERRLCGSPLVAKAAVLLAGAGDHRLSAVVVLTAEGRAVLADEGAFRLGRRLRRQVAAFEEDAALPRRWRFVDAIPTDPQGKRPQSLLGALFSDSDPDEDGQKSSSRPADPVTRSIDRTESGAVVHLHVPADLLHFQGHFEGFPILPGIVQLHWVAHWAAELFGRTAPPAEIARLKFRLPIPPDRTVALHLTHDPGRGSVTFRYASDQGDHASGVLKWREAG